MKLNELLNISHELRQWLRSIGQVKVAIDKVVDTMEKNGKNSEKEKPRQLLDLKPRKDYDKKK